MFKSGKRKGSEEDDLSLELEKDRRRYFRIQPNPEKPVFLEGDSQKIRITDICAGGLGLETGPFSEGREYTGRLILPEVASTAKVTLTAIRPVRENVVGAKITVITEDDRDLIHTYVLHRQKEELEKAKARNTNPG